MRTRIALAVGALVAGGLTFAAPANAGCQGAWTPWGGGTICDGPVAEDGSFERCQSAGAMGFGGTNCFILNVANANPPRVGP
ncbi:Uncharacterised protein [Mycolicibacterium phlei]|jgi:hypothetical protein|uniref:CDGP domain-containing protein n=1 Tax=Mycolicibacterium phlei DSM 43239 = CCUG 21000 TaxID=1226750 RepID=A0A5N5USG9_MYCPH|nr:hypothetical protein [Mycolicibacterium phlei]VEG09312.1 Uncharacterised protein [Mycobacteroides chelonae]AMO61197.1 hypothetical protein MPHLCCUG_02384 [Mycolicibacterium phlei]EID08837.1 hypothetical protein MPHLEI_26662 [Mycolicibacterium phlei RIVM601174]KAB7752556.1 hypothetical protein MPHL21000_21570 [Mycolicibacterium phlei DSM 43239 = CCUG 21000]KXW60906.1 hypothetical protein MPHL43239_23345 [Mycolicibacterium phlei DSM 43239 = CCUG 21000]